METWSLIDSKIETWYDVVSGGGVLNDGSTIFVQEKLEDGYRVIVDTLYDELGQIVKNNDAPNIILTYISL